MLQIAYAIIWWLILLVIGLLAFPLVSRVCGRLPDKGYSISKIMGLLILMYFSWMFASLHLLKFGYIDVSVSLLLLLALSLFLGRKRLNPKNLPLKSVLITEAIFAVAFGLFLFVLSHKPDFDILYSEDFTDFGFLKSILRSVYFPPADPWLAGKSIPYYYGGHLIAAVLITLSKIPPPIAYNLAVAMFVALAVCAAYGLGYNATKRKLFGFVTVVFVCLAGFISGAYQLAAFLSHHPVMGYAPLNAPNIGEWFKSFDFVTANRIIPGTVTQYPYYAYLVGDLHANIMDIPFQLMFMTLVLSLLTKGEPVINGSRTDSLLRIFILGLSLGVLAFINTWSYPIYLAFIVLAFLLLKTNLSKKGIISVIVLSLLLFLPYHLSRGSGGFKDVERLLIAKTDLSEFFQIFALSLFAMFSLFFVLFSRKWFKGEKFLIIALSLTAITGTVAALFAFLLHVQIIWILAPLIVIPLYYIYKSRRKEETQFMLLLILIGALVVGFCEIFFIKDPLGGDYERYNTILKVYMPIWVVWGVPAAYGVFLVSSKLKGYVKAIWVVVLLAFVLAALIHPLASTTSWAGGRYEQVKDHRLTLDGMAYLKDTNNGDYEAILWLNENVKGSHVILEFPGVALEYSSQASALTGLPTVLGWAGWEVMWRDSWDIITERTMAINAIYEAPDSDQALSLLKKYNVEYIYVGTLEKNGTSAQKGYPAESLQKFATDSERYKLVYQNQDVSIYQVIQ
jgi:YYY domain-containing protein